MAQLLYVISIIALFLGINAFAIPVGTHSTDFTSQTSVSHLLRVKPGVTYRKVLGNKGDCTSLSWTSSHREWWSQSQATCRTGEIAIAGGVEKVYSELCDCASIDYGRVFRSYRYSNSKTTWYVLYNCAKVQAYAICVSETNL